ncbi:hypothetical protein [Mycolicibacterium sp. XJ775]
MSNKHRPWHRPNQMLAIAGAPPINPDDWPDIDARAEAIADSLCETDDRLANPNHLERAFGAESWNVFQRRLDILGEAPRDTSFLTAFGLPESAARFDVVCQVVPLEINEVAQLGDYVRVAEHRMLGDASPIRGCGALLSRHCERSDHSKLWAHQRGQVIVVVALCGPCRELLRTGGPMDQVGRPVGTVAWCEQGDPDDMETAINRPDPLEDPWAPGQTT